MYYATPSRAINLVPDDRSWIGLVNYKFCPAYHYGGRVGGLRRSISAHLRCVMNPLSSYQPSKINYKRPVLGPNTFRNDQILGFIAESHTTLLRK